MTTVNASAHKSGIRQRLAALAAIGLVGDAGDKRGERPDPAEPVARKIAHTLKALDANFDLKYGMGGLSHSKLMKNIELYGTQVAPLVRDMLG